DYDIAVASSFDHNLEITNIDAQKGPVIQSYIEELGFTMDDVMVIGDSLNDYSMLSLDFGATVAMGNALKEIKDISQFITKSNEEQGVLHAIEAALNGSLDQLS
ncbi:HAD hydrolase family protein, partial [Enterococcus sp. 12E11_DIV0728]